MMEGDADHKGVNLADLTDDEKDTLMAWRRWIVNVAAKKSEAYHHEGPYNLKTHFLTRETFLDVLNMCSSRSLTTVIYREKNIPFRITSDRLSSRFSYVFQYARMAETNSPLFTTLGFERHLTHFLLHDNLAAEDGWEMPPSKRGKEDGIGRVDLEAAIEGSQWLAPQQRRDRFYLE